MKPNCEHLETGYCVECVESIITSSIISNVGAVDMALKNFHFTFIEKLTKAINRITFEEFCDAMYKAIKSSPQYCKNGPW